MRVKKDCAELLAAVRIPSRFIPVLLGQRCVMTGFETQTVMEVLFAGELFGVPGVEFPVLIPHAALESEWMPEDVQEVYSVAD